VGGVDAEFDLIVHQGCGAIQRHCDERGTTAYSLVSGARRAQAVGQYLRELEISPSQIDTVSYGKERPFSAEHEEACWQQDRRVHFVVMLSAEKMDPCPAGEIARLVMSS
jgi:hypothetical protein